MNPNIVYIGKAEEDTELKRLLREWVSHLEEEQGKVKLSHKEAKQENPPAKRFKLENQNSEHVQD